MIERGSPSSRRAWIEIRSLALGNEIIAVALLAEGVDRNFFLSTQHRLLCVALLAEGVDRNIVHRYKARSGHVALLAEGVDRNTLWL